MGEEVSIRGRESHWGFTQALIVFLLLLFFMAWLHQCPEARAVKWRSVSRIPASRVAPHSQHQFPPSLRDVRERAGARVPFSPPRHGAPTPV